MNVDEFIGKVKGTEDHDIFTPRVFYRLDGKMFAQMCELLKEQEAVEPIDIIDEKYPVGDSNRYKGYRCGKCKEVIPWDANYCLYCGRKVKWE